jgi:hypothetical protein
MKNKNDAFAARVTATIAKFCILRGWTITTSKAFPGYGLVSFGKPSLYSNLRCANIYPWATPDEPEPADYVLHSVIEIAFRALALHKAIDVDHDDDIETRLIQDLCSLVLRKKT